MLLTIKNRKDLEKLNELVLLNKQLDGKRLQEKLSKQNFHENIKSLYEPFTDTRKDTSRDIAKTMTETSFKNNKALENLNSKLLGILIDRGILASFLLSPLSKITNNKNTSQFNSVKDLNSNRVNDLLKK